MASATKTAKKPAQKTAKKPDPPFVSHCVELLAPLGSVRTRRMFGGWGLYVDELFLALIANERLFLKVNAHSRAAFEAAACEPFVYDAKTGSIALGYWSAPADALESATQMQPWARMAQQAALSAQAAKAKPVRRVAKPLRPPRAKATTK